MAPHNRIMVIVWTFIGIDLLGHLIVWSAG
jgi:hypothetical protein